jgi:hypothetical protein
MDTLLDVVELYRQDLRRYNSLMVSNFRSTKTREDYTRDELEALCGGKIDLLDIVSIVDATVSFRFQDVTYEMTYRQIGENESSFVIDRHWIRDWDNLVQYLAKKLAPLKKYDVILSGVANVSQNQTVLAPNEAAARELALEKAHDNIWDYEEIVKFEVFDIEEHN